MLLTAVGQVGYSFAVKPSPPTLAALTVMALVPSAHAQTWERGNVTLERVELMARELAEKPWSPPDVDLPGWMSALTYDQYRDIRFNPDQALWAAENLPFRAMFFHPGYLFREPVALNETTATHRQRIRLSPDFFQYGPLIGERGETPPNAGFAGFRLHHPLNRPEAYDELIAVQGASYWRALGKDQRYGLSARGLAINTGSPDSPEEFPAFREFWLQKPSPDDKSASFLALLDSPSHTGAYAFTVTPGADTTVDVNAVLFTRQAVKRFGIAPMSSMFWFGENSRRRFDDFRPEVHDSDGLAIFAGSGERLWRPLANDTHQLEFSFFSMDQCKGFGLLQRDRRFAAFEDSEANYHLRPSLWIQPTSDWGAGRVVLMEIPAKHELADNIVALWEPANPPAPGTRTALSYRQRWTLNPDPADAGGYVTATRTGTHEWQPEQRTLIVEFTGGKLANLNTPPTASVAALGDAAGKIKIQGTAVQALQPGHWRLSFQIAPANPEAKLADTGPVELRAALKQGDDFLTETWTYRITP